jgi:hypothetical protein
MAITVKDHGEWELYKPDPMPDWAKGVSYPVGFVRRLTDKVDWYEYRKTAFTDGSVIATVLRDPSDGIETVKLVTRDVSGPFPASHRVIEILGFDPADTKPHNTFAWMVYDPAKKALSAALPPKVAGVADYQFAGQAASEGIITADEAMAWVATGKTPQTLIGAVKVAITDPDRQSRVLLFLAGTTVFPRYHELTPLLAGTFGKDTPEKLDAFFAAAAKR